MEYEPRAYRDDPPAGSPAALRLALGAINRAIAGARVMGRDADVERLKRRRKEVSAQLWSLTHPHKEGKSESSLTYAILCYDTSQPRKGSGRRET